MATDKRCGWVRLRMVSLTVAVLCLPLVAWAQTASPATFSLRAFKAAVEAKIASTGDRDNLAVRLAKGQTAADAARDRALDIASLVEVLQRRGEFADYGAKVGTVSRVNLTDSVALAYSSVVEIVDVQGKTLYTIEADNSYGPIYVRDRAAVQWNATTTRLLQRIKPPLALYAKIVGPDKVVFPDVVHLRADLPRYVPGSEALLDLVWYEGNDPANIGRKADVFLEPTPGTHTYKLEIWCQNLYETSMRAPRGTAPSSAPAGPPSASAGPPELLATLFHTVVVEAQPSASSGMTYGNFEGQLNTLAPSGGPCAFKQTINRKFDTSEEVFWEATCPVAGGGQHNINIYAYRYFPLYRNGPEQLALRWTEARAIAFAKTIGHYDDSRGVGRGDLANRQAYAVKIVDSKWPQDIVAEFPSTYETKLNNLDYMQRLKDNYFYVEFDTHLVNGSGNSSRFAVQAGNIHVFAMDNAHKVAPVRMRPIVEAMLAKLPRTP